MSCFRKLISLIAVIIVILNLVACSSANKNLTLDDILSVSDKQDVKEYFGNPDSKNEPDSYHITLMDNEFVALVEYSGDKVARISLTYFYPSMDDITMDEWFSYAPSSKELKEANALVDDILESLTERFGQPSVSRSEIDTTTYSWSEGICIVKLSDCLDCEEYAKLGPIEIVIKYKR